MPFGGLMGYGGDNSTGPKAYLNILVFDQNYQLLSSSYIPVTSAARETGTNVPHQLLKTTPITIEKPGYVYIYTSNENPTPVEVFFDDFKVTHTNSIIVQKDDYYPFGMTFNSYSAPSGVGQKYLYNGKELLDDLNLGLYDFGARYFDPVIGRWTSPDPMASERSWVSPYNYVQNNPMLRIDPDGMLDDYFNREGKYLGSDEAKTDFIRIVDQEAWDANKIVGENGAESILNEAGSKVSNVLSKSGISLDAAKSVYSHYNNTGLPTVIEDNPKGSTASFRYSVSQGKVVEGSEQLVFNHSNLVRNRVSDHANEIMNVVAHEGFHYNEYKSVGADNFHQKAGTNQGRSGMERRAVNAQVNHPTFSHTRKGFQNATINYGMRFGYVQPINAPKRD